MRHLVAGDAFEALLLVALAFTGVQQNQANDGIQRDVRPDGSVDDVEALAQLKQIHGAWEARTKQIRSARLEIVERNAVVPRLTDQEHDKDGIDLSWKKFDDSAGLAKVALLRVAIEGRKIGWESRSPDGQKLQYVHTFDGSTQKSLFFKGPNSKFDTPQAIIMRQPISDATTLLWAEPLFSFFTPLDIEATHFDLSKLTPTHLRLPIDGSECLILHNTRLRSVPRGARVASQQKDYWIDPAKDNALVRSTWGQQNHTIAVQIDIDYRHDAGWGWLLQRWITCRMRNGRIWEARLYEVTKLEVNPKLDKAEFDAVIPPDAKISDYRNRR